MLAFMSLQLFPPVNKVKRGMDLLFFSFNIVICSRVLRAWRELCQPLQTVEVIQGGKMDGKYYGDIIP